MTGPNIEGGDPTPDAGEPPVEASAVTPEPNERTQTITRRGVAKNLIVVAIFLAFTLVVGVAFAYFGGTSVPGGSGAAAATTVNQGSTPTAVAVAGDPSSVKVSWAASTLATGGSVSGYLVRRYDSASSLIQTVLSACDGVIATLTCTEANLPTGTWRYSVTPTFGPSWVGLESAKSAAVASVQKDVTPPVNALSVNVVSGAAYQNGNTIYYKGSTAGSFTIANAVTDAGSGPASSTTSTLTGTSTGWSHVPSTDTTPAGGPYVSNIFTWAAGTTSTPAEAVVGKDGEGNAATTTLTFTNDSTAPNATVSYGNTFEAGRSVAVTLTASDAGSGVVSRQLQRSFAPITGGVCGTFSSFARVGPVNPSSPYTDSQVTNGYCYMYRYVVTDNVGNRTIAVNPNVAKVDYQGAVSASTGLLSQWRLGEKLAVSDSFGGTAGAPLSSREGDIGATWTRWVNDTATAVFTDANRLRRNGVGGVTYLASGVPPAADYQVAVDVIRKTTVSGDYAGVLGRVLASDTSGQGTRYNARYNADASNWELLKIVRGTGTVLGSSSQTLTAGQSYRLSLDMRGTTIRLLVDSVERVSVTDSTITGVGLTGLRLGAGTTGAAPTNSTGLHVDNFKVTPRALDGKGSNNGTYVNQPLLGVTGAIAGDPDTATVFDGTRDAMQVASTVGVPVGASVRSVEAWFKTTSGARQTIMSYGSNGAAQEFGLMVDSGTSMRAWGLANDQTFSTPYAVNDGAWHQAVETFDGSTITIYLDGVALPPQTATRNTGLDSYGIGIGAVLLPGDSFSGSYFNGALDEVSLYTTVLTPATVTNHYALGTSPVPDVTGPTGGSVDAVGLVGTGSRYSTSTNLTLNFGAGTDPSGVSPTGAELQRATATLTSAGGTANGVCGSYGAYTVISGGTDPNSPISDSVADQACYSYHYVVSDTLGNTTTYASADIKVESTAPAAPTLAFSAFTNTYWSGSGSSVVYYRSAATSGSFSVTASATDAQTGIASYTFPALGTSWTSTPGATGVNAYTWSGAPAAPANPAVTATNNATLVSPGGPFTLTADNTAPSGATVSNPTVSHGTSVNVAFTAGSDSGSGVASRVLQRASAILTGGTCGTFTAFTTVPNGTNPTSPLANTVAAGTCYNYQYVVTDNVGNKATVAGPGTLQVTKAYLDTIQGTAGLVNYWRLDEQGDQSDKFTGTTGTVLPAHTADSGFSWTRFASTTITGMLTDQGRLRKSAVSGGVGYYSSQVPSSADYLVESDLVAKSMATNNASGVLGRIDVTGTGTGTFYLARYDSSALQWQLIRNINGNATVLGTYNQTLTAGGSYRVGLDMVGSTIQLLVDGLSRVSATDTGITATGRAGVALGSPGDSAVQGDAVGLQLDNFHVSEALEDSKGTAEGDYINSPTLGVAGAINGDDDSAVTFNGTTSYGSAPRQVSDDLSVEFWFKSTQGIGTGSQWWEGAGLVDAEVSGNWNDFGVTLRSDGRVVGGVGGIGVADVSVVSSTGGFNDGGWHHVVFTRVKSTGVINLYVDGASMGTATGSTNPLDSQPTLSFGRLASGTNAYAGSLDEVSVYNVALSATTVAGHFAAGQ